MNHSLLHSSTSRGLIQIVSEDRIRRLEVCTQFSNLGYTVIPLTEMTFSLFTTFVSNLFDSS
ncbi:MAG TPA: hypothetical protein DDZ90_05330 [Planctomycetaceae bacterium]|nr:hypothetical protein [Planctomycetaceae bacterium]